MNNVRREAEQCDNPAESRESRWNSEFEAPTRTEKEISTDIVLLRGKWCIRIACQLRLPMYRLIHA